MSRKAEVQQWLDFLAQYGVALEPLEQRRKLSDIERIGSASVGSLSCDLRKTEAMQLVEHLHNVDLYPLTHNRIQYLLTIDELEDWVSLGVVPDRRSADYRRRVRR